MLRSVESAPEKLSNETWCEKRLSRASSVSVMIQRKMLATVENRKDGDINEGGARVAQFSLSLIINLDVRSGLV